MASIRIPIVLNRGHRGIPLPQLARVAYELQQFLIALGEDIRIESGSGWLGTNFRDGSFACTIEKIGQVEDEQATQFKQAFRNVATRTPDARVRPSTVRQYAKIAEPLEAGEMVEFGLTLPPPTGGEEQQELYELTKREALLIAAEIQGSIHSLGAVQGVIHSIFFGSSPPHFQLRELSTGELVKCIYRKSQYGEIAAALSRQDAVLHVHGTITTDLVNRKVEEMRVQRVEVADSFSADDFKRFVGCAPGILGDQPMQDFIDFVRGRA